MKKITDPEEAITEATGNRDILAKEDYCSCFSCVGIYPTRDITKWTDENQTALCPRCGVDSVLPGIYQAPELQRFNQHWFGRTRS